MNMTEYCNWPEATADALQHGWLRTGDLGRLDPQGYLEIEARLSDITECRGVEISHAQVERVALQIPWVRQAVAFEVGKELVVAVVARDDNAADRAHTESFFHTSLGHIPRIVTVDSLPRTPSGKVDKRELSRRAQA
jgi:long-chain acyl-CoA synthetase